MEGFWLKRKWLGFLTIGKGALAKDYYWRFGQLDLIIQIFSIFYPILLLTYLIQRYYFNQYWQ